MASTDFLRLGEHKFFAQLRATLPKTAHNAKATSIIAVRDDILYAWDSRDNCVLALNIKTVRLHEGEEIPHQTLLPYSPPLFTPDRLVVNESNSLLAAVGANGVLVFELPPLTPPYGTFYNNKDVNYVRTHSLYERTLAFSTKIDVRQVRFHPGSPQDNHICMLTNDNVFRVFCIENSDLVPQGVFKVGPSITCNVPSSTISVQEALGEVAVDFDFGPPEVSARPKSLTKQDLKWPVYFLSGDATIYMVTVTLGDKIQPEVLGPFTIRPLPEGKMNSEFCSIAVFATTPPILAIANCNGHVSHVLAFDECPEEDSVSKGPRRKNFMLLETLELELGYTVGNYSLEADYSCPIYLHKDTARLGNYFATHETGVHSIEMGCVDHLQKFVDDNDEDMEEALLGIVNEQSSIFYLLCTKTSDDHAASNPVIGFAVYYNPYSYLCFLGNGQLVSQPVVAPVLPQEEFEGHEVDTFPLKKILNNQFEQQIQRILKQGTVQPILKLPSEGKTQQDCYELIKRSAIALREQFANNERARVEIEKRIKALRLLKQYQSKELENISESRAALQDNAEKLAEKYENLNGHQDDILRRCQKLLISISKLQEVPSYAEKEFHTSLKGYEGKILHYRDAVEKLRKKIKYQELQIGNHEAQVQKKRELNNEQAESFKSSLQETTRKISQMMKEVNEYKNHLNLN